MNKKNPNTQKLLTVHNVCIIIFIYFYSTY